jgi:hypothetical protein
MCVRRIRHAQAEFVCEDGGSFQSENERKPRTLSPIADCRLASHTDPPTSCSGLPSCCQFEPIFGTMICAADDCPIAARPTTIQNSTSAFRAPHWSADSARSDAPLATRRSGRHSIAPVVGVARSASKSFENDLARLPHLGIRRPFCLQARMISSAVWRRWPRLRRYSLPVGGGGATGWRQMTAPSGRSREWRNTRPT